MQATRQVALVAINSQYVHSALAPWCLKEGLRAYARQPHQAEVFEGTVNEAPDRLIQALVATKPDLLGLCCYIWNIEYVATLLPRLRAALPDSTIVLGGPEVSFRPEQVLQGFEAADFVIIGEGERPLAALVDALYAGGDVSSVPGLCRRTTAGPVSTAPQGQAKLPNMPDYAQMAQQLSGRLAYIETSRGCPYACAFCLSGREDPLRFWPLEQAHAAILTLASSGARTIKFVDRTFNAGKQRAVQILRFIHLQLGEGIPNGLTFHFEIAGDLIDQAFLDAVQAAPPGLFQFEIGLQSMDENTLHLVRRTTDMGLLRRQLQKLIDMGRAKVHLDLIAGLPEEDLDQFIRGFDQAYAMKPQMLQLGFLKLLHGSAMREDPVSYPLRFDQRAPYQVIQTPSLSAQDLNTLAITEFALDKLHNAGRFQQTLAFLTGPCSLSPFSLFFRLGLVMKAAQDALGVGIFLSLDQLSQAVYQALVQMLPQHEGRLRDLMVIDRLCSTPTAKLPSFLRRSDPRFFRAKRALDSLYPRPQGLHRGLAFLYAGQKEQLIFCDYQSRHPVTGLFPYTRLDLSDLIK